MNHKHVAIIGSGVAGVATALFLKKAGIESTIYESRSAEIETGAGFLLSPNGVKVLGEIGCKDEVMEVSLGIGIVAGTSILAKVQIDRKGYLALLSLFLCLYFLFFLAKQLICIYSLSYSSLLVVDMHLRIFQCFQVFKKRHHSTSWAGLLA
ncbi:FAD-dependent oxidoreductase [Shouchella clausii]|uniref:FAD-dependent oxidoreductase n=1 Tax=Shouchella clausii TaxID=79880 RepID=UPI0012FD566E|nr:FAD-dependent monooxygenase [Shouchella clausii]MCR1288878.1 FAD-dependent monooxygenase [Shouchella clausii]MEB5474339.1 FAD-dependent monooxygenase [Shouchella clausii]QNM44786.1 hypothetical protein DUT88_18655 [Shouchella clausii]WQG96497.1 FAD-dependent monooxygenase [Shouchella clausii]